MTRLPARPIFALLAFLFVVACNAVPAASLQPSAPAATHASPSASATSTPSAATTPSSPTPEPSPSAPAASPTPGASPLAVVRIEQKGGLLPQWETLRWFPSVVLYDDGRSIVQGPQIEIYPGPALPNLQVTHLTQAGIEQVLAWAEEAGLHGPDRQLGEPIMDAGSTVFTVVSPDGTHQTSVTDMTASGAEIGAVNQFQNVMLDLRTYLPNDVVGDDEPYAFDRLRLISLAADPTNIDPQLTTTIEWPLDQPISALGDALSEPANHRCALIKGDELQTLMPLFERSNELTLWQSEDTLYQFYLRPLLPDEEACPVS
jgi:hypothetical protein